MRVKMCYTIISVLMLVVGFSVLPSSSKTVNNAQPIIKAASFNIQIFGKKKSKDRAVMNIITDIVRRFDVVAVQEIRDKSGTAERALEAALDRAGTDYARVTGPRLGRSSCKEQYAFFYRTSTIRALAATTLPDPQDLFHREPLMAYFQTIRGNFNFVLINIHTDPDEAVQEISLLPRAVKYARNYFNEKDVLVLGDFNADCSYFNEENLLRIFPGYINLISNACDTTVKKSVCTYDRMMATPELKGDLTGRGGVFRFDKVYSLSRKQAAKVSDHYPVWAEFYISRDRD